MNATVRPIVRWRFFAFDPISFVAFLDYPHDLPVCEWLKCIPLFLGRLGESFNNHLDGIPSRRNSLKDGQTHRTFSSYAQFFQLLKSMKVKLFVNLMLVFSNFTIEFLIE
jgi:hypothetical protein